MDNDVIWQIKDRPIATVEMLSAALGISPLTASLLVNREITTVEDADKFLNPTLDDLFDPLLLPDMEKARDRLNRAIDTGETIFLHGDYDADGVTSTAIGLRALTAMGANVIPHVPKRSEGYDLQISGVEKAHDAGVTLILTADCGTRALPAIERANELGIEVIITDHHRPGPELPKAYAIVNPYREDVDVIVPFRSLCGAGVLFKLMDALICVRRPSARRSFQQRYLDLVALGTVADMTPLVKENRILVSHGLNMLTDTPKKGLRLLLQSLNLRGKKLTSENIGWSIAPCINAAGRMDDAELAFKLLVCGDEDEATELSNQMAQLRADSKVEAARVTSEALEEAFSGKYDDHRVLVLTREKWGKGVVSLAATRVVEACRRPVILLAYNHENEVYVGSARSRAGFELHTALAKCHDLLDRYGGHSQAAGLSVHAHQLDAFRERINQIAAETVPEEPEPAILDIDMEIKDGRILTLGQIEEIGLLEPFGEQNPEPVFCTRGAEVMDIRRWGADQNTLALQLLLPGTSQTTKAVWFRNGEWAERLSQGDEINIAYTPKINEFKGRVNVELYLKDIKLA